MPSDQQGSIEIELRPLNTRRGQIKSQITRFISFVDKFDDDKSVTELQSRLEKIELLWRDFDEVQLQIELIDDSDEQINYRESFENSFFEITSRAKDIITSKKVSVNNQPQINNIPSVSSTPIRFSTGSSFVQLPSINLPKFDGQYEKWHSFNDSFNALVNLNTNISDVQKFFYLQLSLTGSAAKVISELEATEANYSIAWKLLEERFENKKVICYSHVKALFELQSLVKESFHDLQKLVDDFNKHIRALNNLGEPTEQWSTLLIYLVYSKLDRNSQKEWNRETSKLETVKVENLIHFLTERCRFLETLDTSNKVGFKNSFSHSQNKHRDRTLAHVSQNIACFYYKGSHYIYNCKSFEKLPVKLRYDEIKKIGLCTNCFRQGHSPLTCRSSGCKRCQKKHNTLLHINSEAGKQINQHNQQQDNTVSVQENVSSSHVSAASKNTAAPEATEAGPDSQNLVLMMHNKTYSRSRSDIYVLLSTAIINVLDCQGRPIKARAILDSGSMSSFMSKNLFQKLGLPYSKINTTILGLNESSSSTTIKTTATIQSNISNYKKQVSFLVVNEVTKNNPLFSFDTDNLNIPESVPLADPSFNIADTVDILIGAEIYYDLLCVGQLRLGTNKPILQKSKFGWLVSGPITFIELNKNVSHCNLSANQIIQNKLEDFWRIEEINSPKMNNKQDANCESIFTETVAANELGRFVVTLPMVNSVPTLGDSCDEAINKFLALERRLNKNPELKREYHDFMRSYEKLGHMSKIDDLNILPNKDTLIYYLPHHGVVRENSLTTKLRVVFNGSFETTNGVSLNDILLVGPQLQEDLFSIITRFRKHNYVMIADIEKMYRMVEMTESQRDLQRIIWRYNSNQPLNHYRLNTLTYGIGPPSFLAIRCLHQCAFENREKFPNASHTILTDFYVDDLITGSDSIENSIKLKREISSILYSHGFNLRKWASNVSSILTDNLNFENCSQYFITDDTNHKTLGLQWQSDTDVLRFIINMSDDNNRKVTKRTILSTISQIFDPMGLVGPVTIKAKIILQLLWQSKLDWDDEVPPFLAAEFTQLKKQLPFLTNISIPRHAILPNSILIEMHGFSDASQHAYGACIYILSRDSLGNSSSKLLCAKSRVAPLKVITLPRLELCGALLLTHLADKTEKSLKMNLHDKTFWCDSSIGLNWINAEPNNWQTFVANRVSEIQRLTCIEKWRHISSEHNPADVISRGLDPEKLANCSLWWTGPSWMTENKELWPESNIKINIDSIPEKRKNLVSLLATTDSSTEFDLITRYSSLSKLLRITSYCLRFVNNCSRKNTRLSGVLTLDRSIVLIIKIIQVQEFNSELKLLKSGKSVHPGSKLASLNPFLDKNNLIRVGGGLSQAKVTYNVKFPIVLPSKTHFTNLIISHEHKINLHAGAQATLAAIRHKYWPLKGKSAVKRVLKQCMGCFRVKPTNIFQKMADLPECRVTPTRPFLVCGTDYAGPFFVKDGITRNRKIIKAYLCIFVCFSTKAVHFELVCDLTSDGFLNVFKRFVARRGLCTDIFSDNGTNYVGASNELKQVYSLLSDFSKESKFVNYFHEHHIKWHFSPARSPHFGGLYEAEVKSAKFHLKRTVGDANLTFEQLYTVVVQTESVLNSRPITPLSHEPNDFLALTPGHFIIGDSLTAVPQIDLVELPIHRLTQYQRLQQMFQHFWQRWKHEYLNTLQNRSKWKSQCSNNKLKPGSLVLVKDETTPPLKWPLGRIIDIFPGKDGLTRVVNVKLASGVIFKRAVTKICPLPINDC